MGREFANSNDESTSSTSNRVVRFKDEVQGGEFAAYPSNGIEKLDDLPLSGSHTGAQSSPRDKGPLLYGMLDVSIQEAKCLPNMDVFSQKINQCISVLGSCQSLCVKPKENTVENTHHVRITSDPYVVVTLGDATLAKTKVISNSQDPKWNEKFKLHVAHFVSEIVFTVKDNDMFGAQVIGSLKIPIDGLLAGAVKDGWFDILNSSAKPVKQGAQLKLQCKFTPVEEDVHYKYGVGYGGGGVRFTYFPLRKGGRCFLYQDAHCDDHLPEIELDGGGKFQHRNCWEEICQGIVDAHHMVYIAGWSVYHKVKLIREPDNPRFKDVANLSLGELLKRKAAEGVRVLLLIWDDKTSHQTPFFTTEGVMGTHDEETKKFFRHSSVRCILAPRYGDSKLSWLRQRIVGTLYTHHQKIVIVDSQGTGNTRKLTSFIGGLDLTSGRCDTPQHPLFRTLHTVHRDDYYSPTFGGTTDSGGPRQPWHDLHCMIEGPAAYDVLTNFVQRWKKAARWHRDDLIEIERISWILSPNQGQEALMVTKEDDPESWDVQVFRSIDSGSVRGFPKDTINAEKQNLVSGKNVAVDMSIHTAYVERIRSAQHFIYIENQYFIGSSYAWPDYKNAGSTNMIPMELALKIASKIRCRERFAVYVVIPMWPEGVPDSVSVQEILFFQSQTMQMMYRIIYDALKDMKSTSHPRDYLNFYCLGNREAKREGEPVPTQPPPEKSTQWYAQKYRRFMIYVHSKGMIVDDEYVIIGSANINQRSLEGTRDTEIAMGAYQPHHTWARKQGHPFNEVYGYRASLWTEHLGCNEEVFREPQELGCVRRVNELADSYWRQYVSEEASDMKGHLMMYPIKVEPDGTIGSLPGNETFPDIGGRVLGQHSLNMPDNLTG